MANNIIMKQLQDDGSYNILYPFSLAENINYSNSSVASVSNAQEGLDYLVTSVTVTLPNLIQSSIGDAIAASY